MLCRFVDFHGGESIRWMGELSKSILDGYVNSFGEALEKGESLTEVKVSGILIPVPQADSEYDAEFVSSFSKPIHELPSIEESYNRAQQIVHSPVYAGSFPALHVGDNLNSAIQHFEQCYSIELQHNDLKAQAVRVIEKLITTEKLQLEGLKSRRSKIEHALSEDAVQLGEGAGQTSKEEREAASLAGQVSDRKTRHENASRGHLYHRTKAANEALKARRYVDVSNNLPIGNSPNRIQPEDYQASIEFAAKFFGQTLSGTSNWFEAAAAAARYQVDPNANRNINDTSSKRVHAAGWLYMYTNVMSKFTSLMAVNESRSADKLAEDSWVRSQQEIYDAISDKEALDGEINALEELLLLLKQTYVMPGAPLDFVRRWKVLSQLYQQEFRMGIERLAAAYVGIGFVYPNVASNINSIGANPINLDRLPKTVEDALIQAKRLDFEVQSAIGNSRAVSIRVPLDSVVKSENREAFLGGGLVDIHIRIPKIFDVSQMRISSIQLLAYIESPISITLELISPIIGNGRIPVVELALTANNATTNAVNMADVSRVFNLLLGDVESSSNDSDWQTVKGFKARIWGGVVAEDLNKLELVFGLRDLKG